MKFRRSVIASFRHCVTVKFGFTMTEMIITVSIISLLITAGTFVYNNSLKAARDNRRRADLEKIKAAMELYYEDHDEYPIDVYNGWDNSCGNIASSIDPLENERYLDTIPCDPLNDPAVNSGNNTSPWWYRVDPDGNNASACPSGTGCPSYCIRARLETGGFYEVYSKNNQYCP